MGLRAWWKRINEPPERYVIQTNALNEVRIMELRCFIMFGETDYFYAEEGRYKTRAAAEKKLAQLKRRDLGERTWAA